MRLNDAPEHDCPDCDEHPPLVYSGSVGPTEPRVHGDGMFHHYRCAMCGRKYMATTGEPHVVPSNRDAEKPTKKCFNCGEAMRAIRVAKQDAASGPRMPGKPYARVEMMLVWQCDKCGTQNEFKHIDVLGFN